MQLTDAQRLDWLRLIRTEGVGPRTFRGLINRFGSAAAALDALPDLTRRTGKPTVPASKALAEREMAAAARLGVRYLAMGEPDYPKSLHATDTAPPLIALRGEVGAILKPSVALVGSRNASSAGLAFTERLARGLSEAGLVVVSGLARGIDASAHRASLGGGTVAALAGGHDKIYPTTTGVSSRRSSGRAGRSSPRCRWAGCRAGAISPGATASSRDSASAPS